MRTRRLRPQSRFDQLMDFLATTHISIPALGLALSATFCSASYRGEKKAEGSISTVFSEIEGTTKALEKNGRTVPPLTKLYSIYNDVPMKVFESSNFALARGDDHQYFAEELRTRIDPARKKHALISEYAAEIPALTDSARVSLEKFYAAKKELPQIVDALEKSWTERHDDEYKTVYYTEQECSTNSNNVRSCRTVSKSKQVYEHTDHYYWYHPGHGNRAAALLNAFVQKYPSLVIDEQFIRAAATHAENEQAMRNTLKDVFEDKLPTPEKLLGLANMWADASNLSKNRADIAKGHVSLVSLASRWDASRFYARDTSYRTTSTTSSGPDAYQAAEAAKDQGTSIFGKVGTVTDGIDLGATKILLLDQKIHAFVGTVLEGKPGNADRMRDDIMDMSREIYGKNFTDGFDIDPFSWGYIILMTVLGAALGAGAGFGLDSYATARYNGKRREDMYEWVDEPEESPKEAIVPFREPPPPPEPPKPVIPDIDLFKDMAPTEPDLASKRTEAKTDSKAAPKREPKL